MSTCLMSAVYLRHYKGGDASLKKSPHAWGDFVRQDGRCLHMSMFMFIYTGQIQARLKLRFSSIPLLYPKLWRDLGQLTVSDDDSLSVPVLLRRE